MALFMPDLIIHLFIVFILTLHCVVCKYKERAINNIAKFIILFLIALKLHLFIAFV